VNEHPPDDPRHDLTAELLMAELPDPRFADATYLAWLYEANPYGPGVYESIDDDGTRVAHYGLVPQEYRDANGPASFVFSLNAVTRSGTQRRGYFSEIGRRIWARAADGGTRVVVGVTNDKSRRPVMRQGWRWIGKLPVLVVPPSPRRPRGWERRRATASWLTSSEATAWFADLDAAPAEGWVNRWTPEHLRWRLAWPGCGPYTVHRGEHLVAVSTVVPVAGVPVAVVLKLLPRAGASLPLSGRPAVTEACRAHRAPFAVYAGFNRHVHLRGLPAPDRAKPAPLNLMVYSLDPAIDQDAFVLDTFELLDMDGL
jgi:hypothetical protein